MRAIINRYEPAPPLVEQLLEQRTLVKAYQHYAITRLVGSAQSPSPVRQAVLQECIETAYDEVVLVSAALAEVEDDNQSLSIAVRWVNPALMAYRQIAKELPEAGGFVEAQHLVPRNSDIHRMAYRRVHNGLQFGKETRARDMSGFPYAKAVALGQATLPHALNWINAVSAAPDIANLEARLQQHMGERRAA